jgi:hypothetical protein
MRLDAGQFARSLDMLIDGEKGQHVPEAAASGNMSELPVFILDMPRSGTTLVEQICASHSRIFGAGELKAIPLIATKLAREQRGHRDDRSKAEARRRAADVHILHLHTLGKGAIRVVDKFPDNILFVGLIARLFPRARIVYCSRDRCLHSERNPRSVRTASVWQARQPVYKSSVARWRRYEPWLGSLRELLTDAERADTFACAARNSPMASSAC